MSSTRSKGNSLSGVMRLSWNPRYCYVETPVELWNFFTPSKIHISQEKKFLNASLRIELFTNATK